MKFLIVIFSLLISFFAIGQVKMNFEFDTPYGSNKLVGKYVMLNDAKIYYEEYGEGEPMFLIHGNGGSIRDMGNQIDYFKTKYRVIIADNRGHGKSGLKTDSLTYVQMAKDWTALADHLKVDSLNIIGWSDGGIVGLLMGIHYPAKVKKIVAMGANLRPDSTAVHSWAVNYVKQARKAVEESIKKKDTSRDWNILKQRLGLLGEQPNISISDLSKIKAPVLIIAGDKDIIKEEHSVEMYQNIPQAHLCILPGETHFTPASNPELFNQFAGKFIMQPYKRPDSDFTKN